MSGPGPHRLRSVVRDYDWGSTTALAELLGVDPDGGPQAELWLGAHPMAPSQVLVDRDWVPLDRAVADDPAGLLGPQVVARFGHRLPFLFKVLAAARPLSLQVHPTLAQAREGYAREEAAAIPRRAAHRTYRDRNHKPELLVALRRFDVLAGFRPLDATVDLLGRLQRAGGAELAPWRARLAGGDLAGCFWDLWDLGEPARTRLVASVAEGASCLASDEPEGRWAREASWAARLAALHPADAGVVVALLLNLVRLEPGEGIYAPAGRLHAYLDGVGVEVMASSDNVIRGGLTTKHVDLAELEHVLTIRTEPVETTLGRSIDGEVVYDTPTPDFRLSKLVLRGDERRSFRPDGPELLLCVEGSARADRVMVGRGESLFVPASSPYELAGAATLWRVTVGDLSERPEPERRRRDR